MLTGFSCIAIVNLSMNQCSEAPANVNINAGFKDSSKATGSLGMCWALNWYVAHKMWDTKFPGNGPFAGTTSGN